MDLVDVFWSFSARICHYRHDQALDLFVCSKKWNCIPIAFAHLPTIDTWYGLDIFQNISFRQFECLSENSIEFLSSVSSVFHVLFLVLADRDQVWAVKQYISSHKHRVIKCPNTNFFPF